MFFQFQVGVRGENVVVLGVEKKSVPKLQEERTVRKICSLDDHVVMAFAGKSLCLIALVALWYNEKDKTISVIYYEGKV